MRFGGVALLVGALMAVAWTAGAATVRIFSYDPADDATRHVAGALTFEFLQKVLGARVLNVRATEGEAQARVRPISDEVLGRGGLSRLIGDKATERDLYEILPADEGAAMISAFCPGSQRAFLAFGRLKANQDLRVWVLGADGRGGARLCRRLEFAFHGEWRLPPGRPMDPATLVDPHFPY